LLLRTAATEEPAAASFARPERGELLLLLGRELVLEADEERQVRLLHLALDVHHLTRARQRRLLVDLVGGEQLLKRFGLLLESPPQLEHLLVRRRHLLRDGVALLRREADIALVLHHEAREEELLQERGRAHAHHRMTAHFLRQGGEGGDDDDEEPWELLHARI